MTNKDAIEWIKAHHDFEMDCQDSQAMRLAIKALEERPQGNLTEAEKKICKIYLEDLDKTHTCNEYTLLMNLIDNAPTVEVPENAVNCVLTMFGKCSYNETGCSDCEIKDKIRKALEERPQGEWIPVKTEKISDDEKKELAEKYGMSPEDFDDSWRYAERKLHPDVHYCKECKWLCGDKTSIGIRCMNKNRKRAVHVHSCADYKAPSTKACKSGFEPKEEQS